MNRDKIESIVTGELVKYTTQWDPFKRNINVLVKVKDEVLFIPIDKRQKRFIEKEYPCGSMVDLYYDDAWRIRSKPIVSDEFLPFDGSTVYI